MVVAGKQQRNRLGRAHTLPWSVGLFSFSDTIPLRLNRLLRGPLAVACACPAAQPLGGSAEPGVNEGDKSYMKGIYDAFSTKNCALMSLANFAPTWRSVLRAGRSLRRKRNCPVFWPDRDPSIRRRILYAIASCVLSKNHCRSLCLIRGRNPVEGSHCL
jgi:hypothetical protein